MVLWLKLCYLRVSIESAFERVSVGAEALGHWSALLFFGSVFTGKDHSQVGNTVDAGPCKAVLADADFGLVDLPNPVRLVEYPDIKQRGALVRDQFVSDIRPE